MISRSWPLKTNKFVFPDSSLTYVEEVSQPKVSWDKCQQPPTALFRMSGVENEWMDGCYDVKMAAVERSLDDKDDDNAFN